MATRRPIVLVSGVQSELPVGDDIDGALYQGQQVVAGSGLVGGGLLQTDPRVDVALATNPSGLYFTGDNKLGFDGQGDNIQVIASGVGAVYRTVQDKGRDIVSVKDFGAVSDYNTSTSTGTDNTSVFATAAAAAATAGSVLHIPAGAYKSTTTSGPTVTYTGEGVVYTGSGSTINGKYQRVGNIGGSPNKNHFSIGCIPRSSGGTFSLLDDAGHTPMNAVSVTQPDAYTFRVNYSRTASKINSFIVAPDDALAPYGVTCGGDVGTAFANIKAAAPLNFFVSGSGTVTTTPLWTGSISAAVASNVLTITHPSVAAATDAVVATPINGTTLRNVYASWGETTVELRVMDEMNGYISYNGSSWAWASTLSNNVSSPTSLTWTASNTLRVTHPDAGDSYGIVVTPHQTGSVNPAVYDVSPTFFEVAFYDTTGAQITTQSTNMKFWYRRNVQVQSKIPADLQVAVRRGFAVVPVANWSNVAGNNFWVSADMEV
jgi:hypothetical protein